MIENLKQLSLGFTLTFNCTVGFGLGLGLVTLAMTLLASLTSMRRKKNDFSEHFFAADIFVSLLSDLPSKTRAG